MSRFSRVMVMVAVPVLLAACSAASDTPLSPVGPRHDGGISLTGGNATPPPPDSTATTTSTTTTSSDPGLGPSATDSTNRGGISLTGGN